MAVDISLYPIDTIKTRLQSPKGFWNSGGFARIYSGIGSTISGSAPGVRVPVEVVKQRAQTYHSTSLTVFRETIANGGLRSLYRGYGITILREIPFSLIQFPLWEYLKIQYIKWDHSNTKIQPYQSMICGSVAGAIAAFITTPLDVAKTNIMLAGFRDSNQNINISLNYYQTIRDIYRRNGIDGLFAGAVPRVLWISIGGAIFLGGYEKVLSILQ
ncbi:hypothetical protein RDWZM_010429 [Blomia tropicalis]|uniref:Uncharacterized protein n=1 Tax=Blomia tropicalis TaxID=40697 RepID=A0A9Q0LZ29_BLOTA|nr:hypothetical protein RDWZM_010429 [Blomia tropicalis]